jgi:integrase
MARIVKPLSNSQVTNAKPRLREYNLSDGGGLQLRIKPNGTKIWLFNYHHPITKKRNNISFGSFPDITLAESRGFKERAKNQLANKIDPKAKRDSELKLEQIKHFNTLEHVAEKWFEVKKTKVSPDYAIDIWRSLEMHVLLHLGKVPIDQVNAVDTISVLNPVAAKGSLETVKRVCQRLNEIMIYAVNTGILKHNPLSGIKHGFQSPTKTSLPTIKPTELPMLLKSVHRASIKIVTKCLLEWQLHTMVRPNEAASAEWSEIDINKMVWIIPAHKMKKKQNGDHVVPLTPQTVALLDFIRPISGHRPFIFPSDRNPRTHCNSQTTNMALKRMGYHKKLVAHGLRSLASTTLNEQGFDGDVIEACLAHVDSNEVRRAYNRSDYLERRRKIMDWWSAHIEQASIGKMSIGGLMDLKKYNHI